MKQLHKEALIELIAESKTAERYASEQLGEYAKLDSDIINKDVLELYEKRKALETAKVTILEKILSDQPMLEILDALNQ